MGGGGGNVLGTAENFADPLGMFHSGTIFGSTDQKQLNPEVPGAVAGQVSGINSLINNPNPALSGAMNYAGGLFSPGGTVGTGTNYINNALTSNPGAATPYSGTIANILSGQYLNPSSNPFMQSEIGALGTNFGRTLNQGIDTLNSQFGLSGQSPGSTPRSGAITQFGNTALQDYGNQVANLLGQNYNQGLSMINPALSTGVSSFLGEQGNQNQVLSMLGQPTNVANEGLGIGNNQINQLLALLSGTPLGYPQYLPSQASQNMAGIGALLGGGGKLLGGIGALG